MFLKPCSPGGHMIGYGPQPRSVSIRTFNGDVESLTLPADLPPHVHGDLVRVLEFLDEIEQLRVDGFQHCSIAFGKYLSPDYEVHLGEYIPPIGTRRGTPGLQGT